MHPLVHPSKVVYPAGSSKPYIHVTDLKLDPFCIPPYVHTSYLQAQ